MSMRRLGACMRNWMQVYVNGWVHVCGCWVFVYETVGCKYADVGCKYAVGCMYSMRMLGASMRMLCACLRKGWVHVCGCLV